MRALGEIWQYVADSSCRGYSPLYDRICRVVATSDGVLDLVERAPAEAHNPVLLLAVVHHLVLGGAPHELARADAGAPTADPGELSPEGRLVPRRARGRVAITAGRVGQRRGAGRRRGHPDWAPAHG